MPSGLATCTFYSGSLLSRAWFTVLGICLAWMHILPSLPKKISLPKLPIIVLPAKAPPPNSSLLLLILHVRDYVVHVQYGIARYEGIRRLRVQDFESDYLILQFAGKDTLYVPLDRLNLVQTYRGGDQSSPKLDKLGGGSWARTTARVKKAIEDMAEELVELYASREMVTRRAYGEDSTLICEFDASFEYEETPDQLRVIQEIQRDMESSKPMDRLVCGDVGYGKTEIAMRASFKAVQDNRQVAMLVPTTLLAQQTL